MWYLLFPVRHGTRASIEVYFSLAKLFSEWHCSLTSTRRDVVLALQHTYIHILYKHYFFVRDRDLVRSFFVSASVWDSRNGNFSVKSLRSSAVFGERL